VVQKVDTQAECTCTLKNFNSSKWQILVRQPHLPWVCYIVTLTNVDHLFIILINLDWSTWRI
jgi:hypothetical protein